jgi:hypothetical protein
LGGRAVPLFLQMMCKSLEIVQGDGREQLMMNEG